MELWVEDRKTKKCWKVSQDEGTKLIQSTADIGRYKFYPVCPKDAPVWECPEDDFQQMSIFDYEIR